jgi:hypothetical protein
MQKQHKLPGTSLLALTASYVFASTASAASPYEWTVSQLSHGKTALVLTDAAKTIALRAGWTCVVSSPDANGGLESRTTTCKKNEAEFNFTVQCEPDHGESQTMIQFGKGENADYIEVTCAPRRVTLLPNPSLERTRDR